jgi:hypothetical protein
MEAIFDPERHMMTFFSYLSGTLTYRSTKTIKPWLSQWWNIEIKIDDPNLTSINCGFKNSETVRSLIEKFDKVIVYAWRTGIFFPDFFYMDCLPEILYVKGYTAEEEKNIRSQGL